MLVNKWSMTLRISNIFPISWKHCSLYLWIYDKYIWCSRSVLLSYWTCYNKIKMGLAIFNHFSIIHQIWNKDSLYSAYFYLCSLWLFMLLLYHILRVHICFPPIKVQCTRPRRCMIHVAHFHSFYLHLQKYFPHVFLVRLIDSYYTP